MEKFYCPKCGSEISTKSEDITADYFGACLKCYEENIDKVFSILEKWYKDGKRDIRVYKQTECNEDKGIFSEGDCIFSIGAWPM